MVINAGRRYHLIARNKGGVKIYISYRVTVNWLASEAGAN